MDFEEKVTYFDPSETEEFKVVAAGVHKLAIAPVVSLAKVCKDPTVSTVDVVPVHISCI